jgi:hypothetical protein
MGRLQGLTFMNISHAHMYGSLPSTLANLNNLRALSLDHNHLEGTLSHLLGDGWSLVMNDLSLNNNDFTGTFPANLMNISSMVRLDAYHNKFRGPLPFTDSMDIEMAILNLGSNRFTGTLPSNWSRFPQLRSLYVNDNFLHGPLPPIEVGGDDAAAFISLIQLNAANNMLTGTLPDSLWNHTGLKELALNFNRLRGTIPSRITHLTALQNLDLSSNYFTGQLHSSLFTPTFAFLEVLNLANNSLHGRLPNFSLPSLQVLSLSTNCFGGSLPSTLCGLRSLQYLALDALSQAPSCTARIPERLRPFIKGAFPKHKMFGGIPSCLFEMGNLSVLQLLGNGLTGPIPTVDEISPALVSLNVGHNALTGHLPVNIQRSGQFVYLSAENNRLDGTLASDFAVLNFNETELYLSDNRLSGHVPESINPLLSLKVLSGNLFGCSKNFGSDPSALPEHDQDRKDYVCGSNELNFLLYLWLTTVLLVVGLAAVMVVMVRNYMSSREQLEEARAAGIIEIEMRESRFTLGRETSTAATMSSADGVNGLQGGAEGRGTETRNTLLSRIRTVKQVYRVYRDTLTWYKFHVGLFPNLISTAEFMSAMDGFIKCLSMITVLYALVLIFYIILKSVSCGDYDCYSTRSVQFAWTMTSVFLNDYLSVFFILSVVGCIILSILLMIPLTHLESAASKRRSHRERWMSTAPYSNVWDLVVSYRLEQYCWPLVAHITNLAVVATVNSLYVTCVLLVPKNTVTFVQLSMSVFKTVWISSFIPFAVQKLPHTTSKKHVGHLVFMLLVNYIIGPGIASGIANSQCFHSAIFGSPPTSSVFSVPYTSCDFEVDLSVMGGHLEATTPLVCTTTTGWKDTLVTPPFIYSYQCGSFFLVDYIPVLLYSYLISAVLLPGIRFTMLHCSQSYLRDKMGDCIYQHVIVGSIMDIEGAVKSFRTVSGRFVPEAVSGNGEETTKVRQFMHMLSSLESSESSTIQPLFNGSVVGARRLVDWVVLMTFGLSCPVLAVAVLLSVFIQHATWKLMIGKYLSKVGKDNLHASLRIEGAFVDGTLEGIVGGVRVSIWAISGFWAFIFFDMAADQHGHYAGIYVAVSTFLGIPMLSALIFRARIYYYWKFSASTRHGIDVPDEALQWAVAEEAVLKSPSAEVNAEFSGQNLQVDTVSDEMLPDSGDTVRSSQNPTNSTGSFLNFSDPLDVVPDASCTTFVGDKLL